MPKRELRFVYGLIGLLFVCFLGLPLVLLLLNAFQLDGGMSLAHFKGMLTQASFYKALSNSFLVSGAAALLSTTLAFIMAYTVHYTRLPKFLRGLIIISVSLPMLFPTITYGFAILYSFGKQGLITGLFGHSLFNIYGFNGLLLGYISYTLPTAFLLLHNSFQYIDKKYITVSELMGDSPLRRFFVTALRPMCASIGTSMIATFFLCFTDYGIPAAIGGEFHVISTTLYNQMLGAAPDFGRGAVLATVMLLPSIFGVLIQNRLDKTNFRYSKISQVELKPNRLRDCSLGFASFLPLALVLSSFVVIFIIPFVPQWPYDKSFSLSIFLARLSDDAVMRTLINSLIVALWTAVLGTILAFLGALITQRSTAGPRLKGSIDMLALLTNSIPGMVLGVAYMLIFPGTPLQNTLVLLIICNLVHFFSTPYFMAKNALSKMNASWETTAALMGDTWTKSILRVVLPNSLRTLTEMFGYYFINAMVTVSAVIFIAGARTMVLTTKIKELQHYGKFEEIFVLSLVIFIINLAVKLLVRLMSNKREVS